MQPLQSSPPQHVGRSLQLQSLQRRSSRTGNNRHVQHILNHGFSPTNRSPHGRLTLSGVVGRLGTGTTHSYPGTTIPGVPWTVHGGLSTVDGTEKTINNGDGSAVRLDDILSWRLHTSGGKCLEIHSRSYSREVMLHMVLPNGKYRILAVFSCFEDNGRYT